MAVTPSTMLPLGTPAPDFSLPDVTSGQTVSLADFSYARAIVIAFICNHCPFVLHLKAALPRFAGEVKSKGGAFVAISSNSIVTHPQDGPLLMAEFAKENKFNFPYLYDETQAVAKAYRAACTPDFYLFDRERKLAYRGQFDDSRPKNEKLVTGADLRAAVEAVVSGRMPSEDQKPSIGCNIKWRPGGEPEYYRNTWHD